QQVAQTQLAIGYETVQWGAVHKIHHDVTAAFDNAGVVHRDDVRMTQLRQQFGFALEAARLGRADSRGGVHDLDRDAAARGKVDGLVHDCLPTATYFASDRVARKIERCRRCAPSPTFQAAGHAG